MTVCSLKYLNRRKEYIRKCKRHQQYISEQKKIILHNGKLESNIKKLNKKKNDELFITTIELLNLKKMKNLLNNNKSILLFLKKKIDRTKN